MFLGLWGNSPTGGPVARAFATILAPLESGQRSVVASLTGGTGRIGDLWRASSRLAALRERNRELEAQLVEREELERENRFLRESLGIRGQYEARALPARVLGRTGVGSQSLVVERGSRDGVRPFDAVVAPDGVLGYVTRVLENASSVLLLTDRSASVGVAVIPGASAPPGEGPPPVEGRIQGLPDGTHLLLQTKTARPLPLGSRVVTSRLSTIFPAGLPVGVIRAMTASPGSLSDEYVVEPAVEAEGVESVTVLTGLHRDEAMGLLGEGPGAGPTD